MNQYNRDAGQRSNQQQRKFNSANHANRPEAVCAWILPKVRHTRSDRQKTKSPTLQPIRRLSPRIACATFSGTVLLQFGSVPT